MSNAIVTTNRVLEYGKGMVLWTVKGNRVVKVTEDLMQGDADVRELVRGKKGPFYVLAPGHDPYEFQDSIGSFNPSGKFPVKMNEFSAMVWVCSCNLRWEGPILPSDYSPDAGKQNKSRMLKYTF